MPGPSFGYHFDNSSRLSHDMIENAGYEAALELQHTDDLNDAYREVAVAFNGFLQSYLTSFERDSRVLAAAEDTAVPAIATGELLMSATTAMLVQYGEWVGESTDEVERNHRLEQLELVQTGLPRILPEFEYRMYRRAGKPANGR